jgi:Ca-activated chloride channel homolog
VAAVEFLDLAYRHVPLRLAGACSPGLDPCYFSRVGLGSFNRSATVMGTIPTGAGKAGPPRTRDQVSGSNVTRLAPHTSRNHSVTANKRSPMNRAPLIAAALALSFPLQAEENVILVLDASGSMWGQVNGVAKIEIARETVGRLVSEWDPANALGLVAYGHRSRGECADIETLVPPGPLDRSAFMATVNRINPRGMTPLSAAVIHAAEALAHTERKATVILVSDGEETCRRDPCEVGRQLAATGVDFVAHVIGFDVPDPAHQAQLRCLAENTGGRYFNATDADGLAVALGAVVSLSTEPALPPATASLMAPAEAVASTMIEVRWEGPADPGEYIAFVRLQPAPTELGYAWVPRGTDPAQDPANPLSLRTPAEPGDYVLRYTSPRRAEPVLAEAAIRVLPALATIEGPAEAATGSEIEVTARGPVDASHWIGFAPAGGGIGEYRDYVRPRDGVDRYTLRTPGEPGDYELRYVLDESGAIVASQPIRIIASQARIDATGEATAGARIVFTAHGPVADRHWIGFAHAGSGDGAHLDYVRPGAADNLYELPTPVQPGEYELRYVLDESGPVIARHAIRILPALGSMEAPVEVRAGTEIAINTDAPFGPGNWIALAEADSEDGAYVADVPVREGVAAYTITAPETPGQYELRYMLRDGRQVSARRPLRVTP